MKLPPKAHRPQTSATPRQQAVLDFICLRLKNRLRAPSISEINAHFGWTSSNGARTHIRALVKKGLLEKDERGKAVPKKSQSTEPR
jgi:SOS-response transcriptional repressor LexA